MDLGQDTRAATRAGRKACAAAYFIRQGRRSAIVIGILKEDAAKLLKLNGKAA
jgi:hypothetical protein